MYEDLSFLRYESDIIAKAKSSFIPGHDWQDLAQILRITLWEKLKNYVPSKASERTFAIRIMKSKLIDLFRKSNAQKRYADTNHSSLDVLIEREQDQDMYDTINDLNYE